MRRIRITMCFMFLFLFFLKGQSGMVAALNIGQKCPNTRLAGFYNYSGKATRLSDFKGKLVIIDFFGTFCVPCVKGLTKMDSLQRKFGDKIQILIVCWESKEVINHFYDRYKKQQTIQLPFLTDDTIFCQYFRHAAVPFYVVIDQHGIVKGTPSSTEMNEHNIELLLNNQDIIFTGKNGIKKNVVDSYDPLLIDSIGREKGMMLYHSVVSARLDNRRGYTFEKEFHDSSIGAQISVVNNTIAYLYQIAFSHFNKGARTSFVTWNRVIVEAKDSFKLRTPVGIDAEFWLQANSYCYELILPGTFKGDAHDLMRADMDKVFGYNVRMEKRKTMCRVLKRGQNADRILARGGPKVEEMNTEYIKMENGSWKEMLYWLENKYLYKVPIIDETGFERVDLDINADLTSFSSLSKAFQANGIEFVEVEKEIDMLVIGDKTEN